MSKKPRPWVFLELYTSSRFWHVFIQWIRVKTVFLPQPQRKDHGTSDATLGIPLFGNLSCVLKFQPSNRLLKNILWGFLCAQACFLQSSWYVWSNSIFVHQVSQYYLAYSLGKWNITGEESYVGDFQLSFHLPVPGLFNFICLSIASKQISSLATNRCSVNKAGWKVWLCSLARAFFFFKQWLVLQ